MALPFVIIMLASARIGTVGQPAPRESSTTQARESADAASAAQQRALLNRYCVSCHNQKVKTGGLALDTVNVSSVREDAETWEKVVRKLSAGLMPPSGRPRPARAEHEAFVSWLVAELDRTAAQSANPGRKDTFHRLNRVEYQNVIRDLLAVEVDVTSLLPADDASYGFDNIAGVLKINQSLIEQYLAAAQKISRAAIGGQAPAPTVNVFRLSDDSRQYEHVEGLPFGTRGGRLVRYDFPSDGEYSFRVALMCRIAGVCDGSAGFADTHQLEVTIDGARVGLFTFEPQEKGTAESAVSEVRVPVKAGSREVGAAFLKLPSIEEGESVRRRFQRPFHQNGSFNNQGQSIYQPFLDSITITGPFAALGPGDTPSRQRIFVCRPSTSLSEAACARKILTTLARRGYRRPVTEGDVHGLMAFYDRGRAEGGFESGIELAVRRLLVSPEFLFRTEAEPPNAEPDVAYHISALEQASRLSFFLWSSIPDDELLDVAIRGKLSDADVLERQVRRMLMDDRARALVKSFAGQWLHLRNLSAVAPSIPLFPDFDGTLRDAFRRETELFFESILLEDRPVVDLLSANYTFLNERLARHYGIPHVKGTHFRRVVLDADNPRRGLLGHGSILTVTSRPNRTSPVLRGKWILENILGTPPPEPPANVPAFEESTEGSKGPVLSVRERTARHRANPVCGGCHSMIDPPGFALENFDALGRWRDVDEAFNAVDASGVLPDGSTFSDFEGFRAILLSRPERFVTTVTEKLLTYALGRGLEYYDMPTVRRIVRESAPGGFKLSSLIVAITRSTPFQMRKSEPRIAVGASASRH